MIFKIYRTSKDFDAHDYAQQPPCKGAVWHDAYIKNASNRWGKGWWEIEIADLSALLKLVSETDPLTISRGIIVKPWLGLEYMIEIYDIPRER